MDRKLSSYAEDHHFNDIDEFSEEIHPISQPSERSNAHLSSSIAIHGASKLLLTPELSKRSLSKQS